MFTTALRRRRAECNATGRMQCGGAEREIPVLRSVCSAVEPNGPALKGVDGCGKEKRGVEGAAGGVEGRGIALVGRCPRG